MNENFDLMGSGIGANENQNQNTEGMVFNLADVKDNVAFEVLPKGTYDAVIE